MQARRATHECAHARSAHLHGVLHVRRQLVPAQQRVALMEGQGRGTPHVA